MSLDPPEYVFRTPQDNMIQVREVLTSGDQQILDSLGDVVLEPKEDMKEIRTRHCLLKTLAGAQLNPKGFSPSKSHITEAVVGRALKNKNLSIIVQNQRAMSIFYGQYKDLINLNRIANRRYNVINQLDNKNEILEEGKRKMLKRHQVFYKL